MSCPSTELHWPHQQKLQSTVKNTCGTKQSTFRKDNEVNEGKGRFIAEEFSDGSRGYAVDLIRRHIGDGNFLYILCAGTGTDLLSIRSDSLGASPSTSLLAICAERRRIMQCDIDVDDHTSTGGGTYQSS